MNSDGFPLPIYSVTRPFVFSRMVHHPGANRVQFDIALTCDSNGLINRLLAYDGYSPAMRELFPANLLRAELLKAIKYPEISYRKFCTEEYLGLDRKQNRVFIGLPLHRKTIIDHTQLCKFRLGLSFTQQINLMVYFLHYFKQSGLLGDCHLHGGVETIGVFSCRINTLIHKTLSKGHANFIFHCDSKVLIAVFAWRLSRFAANLK